MYDILYNRNLRLEDVVLLYLRMKNSKVTVPRVMHALTTLLKNRVINAIDLERFKENMVTEIKHNKNFVEVYHDNVLISYRYDD